MTKQSTLASAILKNVDTRSIGTGLAIANVIVQEAERDRSSGTHLRGKIQSVSYDRDRGIGILVDDEGARQHLAAALGFNIKGRPVNYRLAGIGNGRGRTGEMHGFQVTIWNVEV